MTLHKKASEALHRHRHTCRERKPTNCCRHSSLTANSITYWSKVVENTKTFCSILHAHLHPAIYISLIFSTIIQNISRHLLPSWHCGTYYSISYPLHVHPEHITAFLILYTLIHPEHISYLLSSPHSPRAYHSISYTLYTHPEHITEYLILLIFQDVLQHILSSLHSSRTYHSISYPL